MDPGIGAGPSSANGASSVGWRAVLVLATALTVAAGVFAIGAAVTSDDDSEAAPSDDECAAGSAEQVRIAEFAFQPPTVSVTAGSCVAWTNEDDVVHNVRSGDDVISSPDLSAGDSFLAMFDEPGTYEYLCGIHDFMTGTVTVNE